MDASRQSKVPGDTGIHVGSRERARANRRCHGLMNRDFSYGQFACEKLDLHRKIGATALVRLGHPEYANKF